MNVFWLVYKNPTRKLFDLMSYKEIQLTDYAHLNLDFIVGSKSLQDSGRRKDNIIYVNMNKN